MKSFYKILFLSCLFFIASKGAYGQGIFDAYLKAGSQYGAPAKVTVNTLSDISTSYFGELDIYIKENLGANAGARYSVSNEGFAVQGYVGGIARLTTYERSYPYINAGLGANVNLSQSETSILTFGEVGYFIYGVQLSTRLEYVGGQLTQHFKFAYSYSLANFY